MDAQFHQPAGLVSEAVSKYTKVKSIGLCNVPVSMEMMIAEMMECEPKELQLEFAGLNHLVWVHKAWFNGGEDITQTVLEKVGDGANFSMKNIWEEPWDPAFLKALGGRYHVLIIVTSTKLMPCLLKRNKVPMKKALVLSR